MMIGNKQSRFWKIVLPLFFALLGETTFAWAQGENPSNTPELNHRTQQQALEQKKREQQQDVFIQSNISPEENTSLPKEKIAFMIQHIELEGKKADQFSWAQKMLNQYAGQAIGKEGIQIIVQRLSNALLTRGYVTTQVTIPEQDISTGILKIEIIPGLIGQIVTIGSNYANWQTAFPVRSGDILNIRDLEQGMEQMKRIPSQDVNFKIVPGSKIGESNIEITVTQGKNLRLNQTIDDSGIKATGKLQTTTTVSLDQPLHRNDQLTFTFSHDLERNSSKKGNQDNQIQYSFPHGNWTFSLSNNIYNYHENVQGQTQTFQYSGKTDKLEFSAERLLSRNQQSKTGMQFRLMKQHHTNFLDDTEILAQRRNVISAEMGVTHRHYYGQAVLDVLASYRQSVPWLNALTESSSSERYRLWLLNIQYGTPAQIGKLESWYTCHLQAQFTRDVLYSGDFFSIGNRYTVRGFDGEQTLAAETGWYVQNEWSIPIHETQVYFGLDYGEVGGPSASTLAGKRLAGAVLGWRGEKMGIQYDAFMGWPLYRPKDFQTANVCYGFQISYSL